MRTISCGCCTNGCICHTHQDRPRGVFAQQCSHHRSHTTSPYPDTEDHASVTTDNVPKSIKLFVSILVATVIIFLIMLSTIAFLIT